MIVTKFKKVVNGVVIVDAEGEAAREAYEKEQQQAEQSEGPPVPPGGAGTALKAMLATFGIHPTPSCACEDRAAVMDAQGTDWCDANIEQIVDWMAEEAKARQLPMPRIVAVQLVKSAIRKARRAQISRPLHLSKM